MTSSSQGPSATTTDERKLHVGHLQLSLMGVPSSSSSSSSSSKDAAYYVSFEGPNVLPSRVDVIGVIGKEEEYFSPDGFVISLRPPAQQPSIGNGGENNGPIISDQARITILKIETMNLVDVETEMETQGHKTASDANDVYVKLNFGTIWQGRTSVQENAGATATYDYQPNGNHVHEGFDMSYKTPWSSFTTDKLNVQVWDDNKAHMHREIGLSRGAITMKTLPQNLPQDGELIQLSMDLQHPNTKEGKARKEIIPFAGKVVITLRVTKASLNYVPLQLRLYRTTTTITPQPALSSSGKTSSQGNNDTMEPNSGNVEMIGEVMVSVDEVENKVLKGLHAATYKPPPYILYPMMIQKRELWSQPDDKMSCHQIPNQQN